MVFVRDLVSAPGKSSVGYTSPTLVRAVSSRGCTQMIAQRAPTNVRSPRRKRPFLLEIWWRFLNKRAISAPVRR